MQIIEFPFEGISVAGTVVDLEAVSLEPCDGGVFTFGTMSGSTMRIVQAETEAECLEVERAIRAAWDDLPRPLRAYSKAFVQRWVGHILGREALIEQELMAPWQELAEEQSLKWPRLRELMRPPVFYYRWGVADMDRETDVRSLRRAIRIASSVNEVVSREAIADGPHVWWQKHLELMRNPNAGAELNRLEAGEQTDSDSAYRRLPNGNWGTIYLAAIMCHNMMDLQSQAALLLWPWEVTSGWLGQC
ncbi:MAG: hypothetical protein IIB16_02300 [Chloroflexi bacterium]|nr:hypothetical protein [Chloroflexota bacterium]